MKKILSLLILLCLEKALHAQYIYTIKADSVKITNSCDTAELIIENHTQNVCGFLFNKGRGRTEFRRGLIRINDSTSLIGCDTLKMNAWLQGGNRFGTTGIFGTMDNNHIDFYTNGTKRGRLDNIGRFSLDYPVGDAVDAFSLTTLNGTKKWFNIYSDVNGTNMSFNKLTSFAGDLESMRITANGSGSTIETFAYSDLAMKAYGGLDLYGGYGAGATKYIRFFPHGTQAAMFNWNGNFLLGGETDYGYKLAVNGAVYGQYFTNSTTLLDAGDGALRLRWGGPGGSYIDFYNQGNNNRRGFISSGADGRPLALYDQIGLSLSTTPFLSVGTEWPTAQNTKFSLTTAFNSTQDPMRVANLISADGLSSTSYLRVKASGNTILGEGEDYGYKLAVNGTTYSQFYTNSTTPLGAGGSGALRLRWGGGEGTYVDFYYQGRTSRRGYIGSPSDSRPLTMTDSIGLSFLNTPYITMGIEDGASQNSRFTIASNRASNWDPFTILGVDQVFNKDFAVKVSGNTIVGGDGGDNGKKFQVNGTSWFRDQLDAGTDNYYISVKPNYGNGYGTGIDASMISFGNIFASIGVNKQIKGNIPDKSLIIGGVSPGHWTTLVDYNGNPTIISHGEGAVTINGGYNGISNGGSQGVSPNAVSYPFNIYGGRGTGSGTPGDINFATGNAQASGTTIHTMTNRWTIKGGTGYLSNSPNPTSLVDINGTNGFSHLRLRQSYTPSSTSDTNGNVGDVSWDDNYFYIKTSSGWKRSALSTF